MKNTLKFLGIGFALVLLVMSQQMASPQLAEAAVAEDDVQWLSRGGETAGTANAAGIGTKVKYYAVTDVASFYIRDGVLNGVTSGRTLFAPDADDQADVATAADADSGCNAAGECFNLQTAVDNPKAELDALEQTTAGVTSTTYAGTATPLVAGSLLVKQGNQELTNFAHKDETAGKFSFLTAYTVGDLDNTAGSLTIASVIASYDYNTQQTYANSGSSDLNALRAKVTSTSDSTGEWIAITETNLEGGAHNAAATAANNSDVFVGRVAFSTDAAAAAAGTDNGASVRTVWVADGDTVTVTYYGKGTDADSDGSLASTEVGAIIDTATFTIDSSAPTISNVTPADGTVTKDTSPQFSFTIADSGIGFESTSATIGNHVDLKINGCDVLDTELNAASHSTSSIDVTFDLAVSKVFSDLARNAADNANMDCTGGNLRALATGLSGFNVVTTGVQADATLKRTINGTKFTWEIIAKDDAGNAKTLTGTSLEVYMDSVVPSATSVTAAKKWDVATLAPVSGNNSIQITMAESVDASTVEASDFLVSGTGVVDGTVTAVGVHGTTVATGKEVFLTLGADLGPNATPKVELVGQISDLAGNVWKVPSGDADGKVIVGTATDGVESTISAVTIDDQSIDALEKATITFASNENLVLSGTTAAPNCTCAYVVGGIAAAFVPDGTDITKIDVTLTDKQAGKATMTQGTGALNVTSGIFGVLIRGRDAATNTGLGGISKITNEDVSDQFTADVAGGASINIKLKNGPLADHDGDRSLADSLYLVTDDGVANVATVTLINWTEAEIVRFTLASTVVAGSQVRINYWAHDAASIIEVDTLAPAVTVTPGADSSTENLRQRITLAFDEDEYAFDSMTTVTVSKAELKEISTSVITDISGNLVTSDNKSFYYKPAADLNLGQYEVKVSATDTNGNALTDATSKFTVKDKAKTTIAMEAGWNLISVPANPKDTAINSVITNNEVTTVLTYDPSIPGGWLTAVRDAGVLSGTLTTIDATRAYWIYQEDGDDIKTLIPGTTAGVSSVPPAIAVAKGWNLLPVASMNNATGTVKADTYLANLDWNKAKGWDATTELWTDVVSDKGDGDLTDGADLTIGKGYWVFANKAGTLIP